jgi:hypothetical protein
VAACSNVGVPSVAPAAESAVSSPSLAAAPRPSASAASSGPATTSVAIGCRPSAVGVLHDDGFVPISEQFSPPQHPIGAGWVQIGNVSNARVGYVPLLPKVAPAGRTLQFLLASGHSVFAAYSHAPATRTLTDAMFMASAGILVLESPDAGQDGRFVLNHLKRNRWPVAVGPYVGALVWGDEVAEGVRPFGLYWADGVRQWIVRGTGSPDELIDLARSIYC